MHSHMAVMVVVVDMGCVVMVAMMAVMVAVVAVDVDIFYRQKNI